MGAHHRYVPLLMTVPGVGWVLAYTIAAEIGDIGRFAGPKPGSTDSLGLRGAETTNQVPF
jgi:hypothetical protein